MDTKFKVIAFDVDGTLVDHSVIKPLNDLFGVTVEEELRNLKLYLGGSITLKEWFQSLSDSYSKHPASYEDVIAQNNHLNFMPHAENLIVELNKTYSTAVISSGYDTYVDEVAKRLNMAHSYYLCKMKFNDEGIFERIVFTSQQSETVAKVEAIKDLQKIYDARPEEVMFVGDSMNDLDAFEYTGRGVLIGEGDESLRAVSWKHIDSLKEVLDFL